MVDQVQLNLNVPLDSQSESTLVQTNLLPQYATASIVLHGDYYTQAQSKLNRYILNHTYTKSFIATTVGSILIYRLWDYIVVSSSIIEFLNYAITKDFIYEIIASFPLLMGIAAIIAISTYFLSDDLKEVAKKLIIHNYVDRIFGTNIVKFAKSEQDDQIENTHILLYRKSPIAIVSLVPEVKDGNFIVKITGLHVRKVFAKVNFEETLLEWSIVRARKIFQEYIVSKKISKNSNTIQIEIECYNWDKKYQNLLNTYQFSQSNESYRLNPFVETKVPLWQLKFSQFFNLKRLNYQLVITTEKDDVEFIKEKIENEPKIETIKPKVEETSTRRRK